MWLCAYYTDVLGMLDQLGSATVPSTTAKEVAMLFDKVTADMFCGISPSSIADEIMNEMLLPFCLSCPTKPQFGVGLRSTVAASSAVYLASVEMTHETVKRLVMACIERAIANNINVFFAHALLVEAPRASTIIATVHDICPAGRELPQNDLTEIILENRYKNTA